VNVARPALDGGVNRGVHEPDDRTRVGGHLLDGELLISLLVLVEDLQLEALGGVLEDARRAFALLQNRLDRRCRRHHRLDRGAEQHAQLVDHRNVSGIADDDDQRVALASVGHEPVAQHQLCGDRAEEIVIDVEVREVQER
jgi:hypothetical protein